MPSIWVETMWVSTKLLWHMCRIQNLLIQLLLENLIRLCVCGGGLLNGNNEWKNEMKRDYMTFVWGTHAEEHRNIACELCGNTQMWKSQKREQTGKFRVISIMVCAITPKPIQCCIPLLWLPCADQVMFWNLVCLTDWMQCVRFLSWHQKLHWSQCSVLNTLLTIAR